MYVYVCTVNRRKFGDRCALFYAPARPRYLLTYILTYHYLRTVTYVHTNLR